MYRKGEPSCCPDGPSRCNRAAKRADGLSRSQSGRVLGLVVVLKTSYHLSFLGKPIHNAATPPDVASSTEPVTQAQSRTAAGMISSNPASTSALPAGPADGATHTHHAGHPHRTPVLVKSDRAISLKESQSEIEFRLGTPGHFSLKSLFYRANTFS